MSGRIRFSRAEIRQSMIKLYNIAASLEEDAVRWNSICSEYLNDLPEREREIIETMSFDFYKLQDQLREHADTLRRVSAVYEKIEGKNKAIFRDLERKFEKSPAYLKTKPLASKGAGALLKWNGQTRRKYSWSRKRILEDWLADYLIKVSFSE